jgi:hypothetical protein
MKAADAGFNSKLKIKNAKLQSAVIFNLQFFTLNSAFLPSVHPDTLLDASSGTSRTILLQIGFKGGESVC